MRKEHFNDFFRAVEKAEMNHKETVSNQARARLAARG